MNKEIVLNHTATVCQDYNKWPYFILVSWCLFFCSLSDSEGGGDAAEELHAQHRADGSAPPLPVRYDQAIQQQQREQAVCGYTRIRDVHTDLHRLSKKDVLSW